MTAYTTPAVGDKVRNIRTGREFVVASLQLLDFEQGDGPELCVVAKGERGEDDVWSGKAFAFEPVDEDVIDAEVVEDAPAAEMTDGQIAAGAMVTAVNTVHAADLQRCKDHGAHLRASRHTPAECPAAEDSHAEALAAVVTVESNPGYCSGCGTTFRGAAGLRSHQSRPYITLACRPRR